MNTSSLPVPLLVTRPAQLHTLAETLQQHPLVAVDTESNSLHAYQERVCLIQFSVAGLDALVDPLALEDLSPLAPLFANPQIEKIFHAAEYDLLCLKRDYGFTFANLFDTMIAARILGWDQVGLGSILKALFGVELEKRYQRADWGARPLSPALLAYARLDTHYLLPLREQQKDALLARDLWPLAEEDFTRACCVAPSEPAPKDRLFWKVNGAHDLTARQAAVLQELYLYRDAQAERFDRPPFKVLGNATLVSIVEACPRSLKSLGVLKGMTPGQLRRHGNGLLAAVERGLRAKPPVFPRTPRPEEAYLNRVEALRTWRKNTARDLGVESDVVMPRDLLYDIAGQNPAGAAQLAALLSEVPWRFHKFGGKIMQILEAQA